MMKRVKTLIENELNAIQLYELGYIDQNYFFDLFTGCGEQTIAEEGIDRFLFYINLIAVSDKAGHDNDFAYFIIPYPLAI